MPERYERLIRLLSFGLGAILCIQFIGIAFRSRPLAHVTIPALPTLTLTNAAATNALPVLGSGKKADGGVTGGKATNSDLLLASNKSALQVAQVQGQQGTNAARQELTNSVTKRAPGQRSSNSVPSTGAMPARSNTVAKAKADTNAVAQVPPGRTESNAVPGAKGLLASSNHLATLKTDTNSVGRGARETNAPPRPEMARMGMNPFPGGGPGGRRPALPPATQARVDRIVESEIFAPVVRPMPMALLGIAGDVAFLRAPNGQTGLVKEKDELGGVKVLRIGTNRILVEEDGQPKELTIFSGYGGESLLPQTKENPK